jgi:threonine/homoserine/homoserine lactone efflux protein
MLSLSTSFLFFGAAVLLALAPGPDNIFVLTQAALRGKAAGLFVTLGLCTGLIVHTTAVALGVAAIFQASMPAFNLLKTIGAAYLLYLAWQAFHAGAASLAAGSSTELTPLRLYRRGIIMNVTNPKVSIFFLAFLPQFTDASRGSIAVQMILLGLLFILATILIFGGIALIAGTLGQWLGRSPKAQVIMNRVAGTIFAALALRLATTNR